MEGHRFIRAQGLVIAFIQIPHQDIHGNGIAHIIESDFAHGRAGSVHKHAVRVLAGHGVAVHGPGLHQVIPGLQGERLLGQHGRALLVQVTDQHVRLHHGGGFGNIIEIDFGHGSRAGLIHRDQAGSGTGNKIAPDGLGLNRVFAGLQGQRLFLHKRQALVVQIPHGHQRGLGGLDRLIQPGRGAHIGGGNVHQKHRARIALGIIGADAHIRPGTGHRVRNPGEEFPCAGHKGGIGAGQVADLQNQGVQRRVKGHGDPEAVIPRIRAHQRSGSAELGVACRVRPLHGNTHILGVRQALQGQQQAENYREHRRDTENAFHKRCLL